MCIWLPNWPIQRWSVEEELPPESSLVLWSVDPRRGRVVVAASEAAQRRGVRAQMPLVEARSLLPRTATDSCQAAPVIAEYDPAADLAALRELAETLAQTISPLVATEPLERARWAGQLLHQPDSLLLDVTGIGELFGDEETLLRQAAALLEDGQWSGRLALTSSVGSAWAMAHYAATDRNRCRFAIPAQDAGSADGSARTGWLVPADDTPLALEDLPVTALRLPVDAAQKLHRLGIGSIGELLRLPRGGLTSRLGPEVLQRIDQALGTADQALPIHHAAPENVVTLDLEYPSYATDLLKHRIEQLTGQLAAQLKQRQTGVLRLTCRFDLEHRPPHRMQLGLFAPTADAKHLTSLLHGVFEQQRLPAKAHRIVIAAPLTGPLRMHQPALLDAGDSSGEALHLARLVDGLSSRLGRQRVLGIRRSNNPLPEQAFQATPLTGRRVGAPKKRDSKQSRKQGREAGNQQSAAPVRSLETTASPGAPLRRPLDLLPKPRAIAVTARHTDGWPLTVKLPHWQAAQTVVRAWGPERIETGWWQGPSIRRDYYRIETETGQWLWVFRQLGNAHWMLHGWFG